MFLILLLNQVNAIINYPLFKHLIVYDPLHDIHQVEYLTIMKFGSQEIDFELIIDTGSADLWVPSAHSHGFSSKVKKFDCGKSKSCSKTKEHVYIEYDDGPISGVIAWDQIYLDQIKFNQSFLLVSSADDAMSTAGGILGLGFHNLAQNKNPSILQSLKEQKLIDTEMFSLYLKDSGSTGSQLIFGGIDYSYIKKGEQIVYQDILNNKQYLISVQGINLGGQLFPLQQALIDSGTSCMTFPSQIIDEMLVKFQQNGVICTYRVETYAPAYCMTNCIVDSIQESEIIKKFPDISIILGNGHSLILHPSEYIYECVIISGQQSKCFTKLERSEQDYVLLLGDAFLQSYYTVFDQTNMKMGFVHSINDGGMLVKSQVGASFSVMSCYTLVLSLIFLMIL